MGHQTLVYRQKLNDNLKECYEHLLRLVNAFESLKRTMFCLYQKMIMKKL